MAKQKFNSNFSIGEEVEYKVKKGGFKKGIVQGVYFEESKVFYNIDGFQVDSYYVRKL